ncbi:hypothetical protein STIAU_8048 [Stigmatella aurantiaca DW4/3-1]|uniref:Uncharacterized protein n=1 Tax=Stigmatella aurantiaca (strain DW4/3-1) TaxID=378806 RepID=Q09BZ0_STIAD|nr:hypothetical protein STIAU_8048 [Stigmatella aurantiaca DW4/3-1]
MSRSARSRTPSLPREGGSSKRNGLRAGEGGLTDINEV